MHLVISGGVGWFFSPFLKVEMGASYLRREEYGFPSSALGLPFKEYGFMLQALVFTTRELGFTLRELDFTMQELGFTLGELGFTLRELGFAGDPLIIWCKKNKVTF